MEIVVLTYGTDAVWPADAGFDPPPHPPSMVNRNTVITNAPIIFLLTVSLFSFFYYTWIIGNVPHTYPIIKHRG